MKLDKNKQNLSIAQMKGLQEKNGLSWFSDSSMNFFNTEFEENLWNNVFITSDRMRETDEKRYAIRFFNFKTNRVETISIAGEQGLRYYNNFKQAKKDAKDIARNIYNAGYEPLENINRINLIPYIEIELLKNDDEVETIKIED